MQSFHNKVAAITGAGSGMGRELALGLAKEGCHLAISDINGDNLATTVTMLANYPIKVTTKVLDVANKEAFFAWADEVVHDHQKVNMIFNNAGVGMGAMIESTAIADIEWLMNINFWGVVYGTKAFLPYIQQAGEGHIINTSSIFGILAQPTQSAYNASKFAIKGFTESLRQELELQKVNIGVTCVHPGGIRTAIVKNARMNNNIDAIGYDAEMARRNYDKFLHYPADKAARNILKAVKRKKGRLLIGYDAIAFDIIQRISPTHYTTIMKLMTNLVIGRKTKP